MENKQTAVDELEEMIASELVFQTIFETSKENRKRADYRCCYLGL